MGNDNSHKISTKLNHPDAFYFAGEKVTGVLSFNNTGKQVSFNNISLELIGELGYEMQDIHPYQETVSTVKVENCLVYHRLPFLHLKSPLDYSRDRKNKITIEPGQHLWSFEFELPQALPPTSNCFSASYPYVKYYLNTSIEQSWHHTKKNYVFPLIISPHTNIYLINERTQSISSTGKNRKGFILKATLCRQGFLPGDQILFDIDLENPKQLKIKNLQVTLVKHHIIGHDKHIDTIGSTAIPNLKDFNDTSLHQTCSLQIPTCHLPPTYTYSVQCSNLSIGTAIYYRLKLEAKFCGLLNGITLHIPVIIGTDSFATRCYSDDNYCMETPIDYDVALEDADNLPTYESAIQNLQPLSITN